MKLFKKLSIMLSSLLVMASLGSAFAPKYNSHADETNTWNITRRITSKQFSAQEPSFDTVKNSKYYSDGRVYLARMNKRISHKVDNYLIRVRNLHKYHLYFSRVTDINTRSYQQDITATVTFIRK